MILRYPKLFARSKYFLKPSCLCPTTEKIAMGVLPFTQVVPTDGQQWPCSGVSWECGRLELCWDIPQTSAACQHWTQARVSVRDVNPWPSSGEAIVLPAVLCWQAKDLFLRSRSEEIELNTAQTPNCWKSVAINPRQSYLQFPNYFVFQVAESNLLH